jgi:hypothetical protein
MLTGSLRIAVHVLAWGVTQADIEHALYKAGQGPSRNAWEFAEVERLTGIPCPIDVRDPAPTTIATDAGYHWAYAVYPLSGPTAPQRPEAHLHAAAEARHG